MAAAMGVMAVFGAPEKAQAYDIDCAIMLCMAGGFPPSAVCSAAHAEMIRRITPWPSRPPFGICSYAGVPASLGGPGGTAALDISTRDYAWLRRTHVIWWWGRSYQPRDEPRRWAWRIRSCDHDNRTCRIIAQVSGSQTPWPATFVTENGQQVATPTVPRGGFASRRAVMMEYGDYDGALDHTGWVDY
ncbi:MAG: hypothetical protein KDK08_14470, partial [Rhizobiaceae bacterium]|nr:hypothetical protein [Rhizobiaceae bacterium]